MDGDSAYTVNFSAQNMPITEYLGTIHDTLATTFSSAVSNMGSVYGNFIQDILSDGRASFTDLFSDVLGMWGNMLQQMLAQLITGFSSSVFNSIFGNIFTAGTAANANTGFNIPFGGIGNLIPDSVLNTALLTYGGVDGLTLGAASTIVTPAMEAAGLTAGTAITVGSVLPYVGIAAGLFGLLGGGLLDSLFGSNAGWGFQTPAASAPWGQTPWTLDDFWVAGGSNGTPLEDLSEITTHLLESIGETIETVTAQVEQFTALVPANVGKKMQAALENLSIEFEQFGINEENFEEMIQGILQFASDEIKRQAAPVVATGIAETYGTAGWISAVGNMSDDSDLKQSWNETLGWMQKMAAEQKEYGKVTVETADELYSAISNFYSELVEADQWFVEAATSGLQAALAPGGTFEDFKSSFYDSVYSGITSAIIDSLVQKAIYDPLIASLGDQIRTAATAFIESGFEDISGFEQVFDTLAAMLEKARPGLEKLIDQIAVLYGYTSTESTPGSNVTRTVITPDYTDYSDQINAINEAVQAALYGTNDLAEALAGINSQWEEYKNTLKVSGHWDYDPEFAKQFKQAWDILKNAAVDDAWGQIVADYREAMGTADDLAVVVAAVDKKWDEHIETLKVAASALGLTNAAMEQYIALAEQAREAEIAKAEAERIKTLTDPFHDLAGDLAAMQYNLAGFHDLFASYQQILSYLQQNGYQAQWNVSDISGIIPAGMSMEQLEEYLPLIQDAFSAFFSIMSDRWTRWESIKDQARSLYDQMAAGVDTASVLESVPTLNTAAMDETFGENTLNEAERYIQELTEWVSTALDVRRQIADFNKAIESQKAAWQTARTLAGLTTISEQKAWYEEQLSAGIAAMAGMDPEDALEKAAELQNLAVNFYEVQKSYLTKMTGLVESIEDKIRDLIFSDFNLALPTPKAEKAEEYYADIFAGAQTGNTDAVKEYLDFINTYLSQGREAYKSSQNYLDMWDQVMADLESLGLSLSDANMSTEATLLQEANQWLDKISAALLEQDQKIVDAMAPHYALLEEALADGGHLDVIFSDMAGWLKNAAEYLQQINAALGGEDIPLYLAAATAALAGGTETGTTAATNAAGSGGYGLGGQALRDYVYNSADAYSKAMMDFQAAGLITSGSPGATSSWSANNAFGATAAQYQAAVKAGYMADLGAGGTGEVYKYNADTGMVESVGNVSDLLPQASGGGDFSGPQSGYLVQLHGDERVKKKPLSGDDPQTIQVHVHLNADDPAMKAALQKMIRIEADYVSSERAKRGATVETVFH